jgi:hypothetical protein
MAELAGHQGVVPFQGNRSDQRIRDAKTLGETVVVAQGHRANPLGV